MSRAPTSNSNKRVLSGINIQWPWSQLLLSGEKSVETRSYALPKKYLGVELAIIETPGPRGKKEAGIEKARIIGTITFREAIRYSSQAQWTKDKKRHCVDVRDPQFAWGKTPERWGWIVASTEKLQNPIPPPKKRGIVFASECIIPGP